MSMFLEDKLDLSLWWNSIAARWLRCQKYWHRWNIHL